MTRTKTPRPFAQRSTIPLLMTFTLGAACSGDASQGPNEDNLTKQLQAMMADVVQVEIGLTSAQLKAVKPVVKCVDKLSATSYRAHFGYTNSSAQAIAIPMGFNNRFFPNPANRGQPTTFLPGAQTDVVQTSFPSNGSATWILGSTFQFATANSTRCLVSGGGTGGAGGNGGAGGKGGSAGTGGQPQCPSTCDDHNPCTVDLCNASTQFKCTNVAVVNGTVCTDGNACTTGDQCIAGTCVAGTARNCGPPSDGCHLAGVCNPASGACSSPIVPNGTACNDGNVCSVGDACQNGACTPMTTLTPTHCAGSACDTCSFDPVVGNCVPATDGCDSLASAANRQLCEDLYACFVNPANHCTVQGSPLECWCGSNSDTCLTDDSGPTQANGPCLQQVTAGAGLTATTYSATTIRLRLADPDFPLGRAVNLTNCRGIYCSAECAVP
jgi:hypothetical protein